MKYRKSDKFRVDDILYNAVRTHDLRLGDLVLDTKDMGYGCIDTIRRSKIAIRGSSTVVAGVPIKRVRKLIPALETNSLN